MKFNHVMAGFYLLALAVLLFACVDANEDNEKIKEVEKTEKYLLLINIADRIVIPGEPGENINTAETVSVTIPNDQASGIVPSFVTQSENTAVFYGKMKEGEGLPPLSGSAALNFENGDYLVIRVLVSDQAVQFYKVLILVVHNDTDAYLASLSLAGRDIALGNPGETLAQAETVKLTLDIEESYGITPIIVTRSPIAHAVYGNLKHGGSSLTLAGEGSFDFENGDCLIIKVISGDGSNILFYIVEIAIKPPPTQYEIFQRDYMTFADNVYTLRISTAGGVEVMGKTDADYVDSIIDIDNVISNWEVRIRGRGNSSWSNSFNGKYSF